MHYRETLNLVSVQNIRKFPVIVTIKGLFVKFLSLPPPDSRAIDQETPNIIERNMCGRLMAISNHCDALSLLEDDEAQLHCGHQGTSLDCSDHSSQSIFQD